MKFKLFIKPNEEEIVQAQLHRTSKFSEQLEDFVMNDGKNNSLIGFDEDKEIAYLNFDDI